MTRETPVRATIAAMRSNSRAEDDAQGQVEPAPQHRAQAVEQKETRWRAHS